MYICIYMYVYIYIYISIYISDSGKLSRASGWTLSQQSGNDKGGPE